VRLEGGALDGERLPSSPGATFQRLLLDAVRASSRAGNAVMQTLDPTVLVLVLPGGEKGNEPVSEEIDRTLLSIDRDGRSLSSLTWSALRDARPPFSPTYHEWAEDVVDAFDGACGLVFFVDVEGIARSVALGAQGLGFTPRLGLEKPHVIVSDGRYEAHVGVNAVIAEAIWTGRGPLAVVQRRTRALPSEFRSFLAVHGALRRRYVGSSVEIEGGVLRVRQGPHDLHVDYRHIAASARASEMALEPWLERASLEDLAVGTGEPALLLRSRRFLSAYPDALHESQGDATLVAVRIDADDRVRTVRRAQTDSIERFDYYRNESRRQMSFLRFVAHGFVFEEDGFPVVGLVGDRAASIVLAPELVRGVCEQLFPPPREIRAIADAEDCLLMTLPDAPEHVIALARRRVATLEKDLVDDRSDRLSFDAKIELPSAAAGAFTLTLVDDHYFLFREEAETALQLTGDRGELFQGMALQSLGRVDKAIGWFERAVRAHAGDGEAHLALGQALSNREAHARALPFLERAAELLPSSAEAQNAVGLARYVGGNIAGAHEAFESAVRLEPMDSTFLVNLGRSYADQHLFHKARACLERALRLEPASADAHASMALVCQRTGDIIGARRHAREALAEAPDDKTVKRLLEALEDDDS
jgi:tetratricopeptide (TPR) repeat protein